MMTAENENRAGENKLLKNYSNDNSYLRTTNTICVSLILTRRNLFLILRNEIEL